MAYRRALLIDPYLNTKFYLNQRNFLWMDGQTAIKAGFISSTPPSQLKTAQQHGSDALHKMAKIRIFSGVSVLF